MRTSTLSTIASEIANLLSLEHNKKIAYKIITQFDFCVMIGLCVEPSRFTPSVFSVRYFVQALYLPSSLIDLSLGDIIGEWEKQDLSVALSVIQDKFKQLFSDSDSINTIIDQVNNYTLPYFGSLDNKYEFFAYSYLVINRYDCAIDYLNKLVSLGNEENALWYEAQIKRAKRMLNLIKQENWGEIKSNLLNWQKQTISSLHLSK